jgi:hypothetical protein
MFALAAEIFCIVFVAVVLGALAYWLSEPKGNW